MSRAPGRHARDYVLGSEDGTDSVLLLSLYLVLLFAIPSRLTFAPLGGAGSPAALLGLVFVMLWVWSVLSAQSSLLVVRPVRRAAFFFLFVLLVSFVAACRRPTSSDELRSAQLGLLLALSWLGVMLVVADGIVAWDRLRILLRRLALATGFFAAFGLFQYVTGRVWTNYIVIPGLSANNPLSELAMREGLFRPASTALHPIEFGATVSCLLPICLHVAFFDKNVGVIRRWFPVGAIALAVPISISRSALLATAAAIGLLLPTWAPARRRFALVLLAGLSVVIFAAFPGVIGAFRNLFSGSAASSTESRTGSYALAVEFIKESPIFGRGVGTFLPSYRILDNQFLLSTIETGLVGLLALTGLFVTAIAAMVVVRSRSAADEERHLAQAMVAALTAAALCFSLFDALSFPIFAAVTFLLAGLCGSLWMMQARQAERTRPVGVVQ